MTAERWLWPLGSAGVTLAILLFWAGVSHWHVVSPVFLPTPFAAFAALRDGLASGEAAPLILGTVQRMIYGWALASLAGIALGALIGISLTARQWLQPMLEFIRPIPASSIMPLAIALFGLSPGMILIVIGFGAVWPVLLATVQGFASVDPRLGEVARVLGLSRLGFIVKIGLPNALPDIFSGMRLSLTVSLILAVVGEMLTSQNGLGLGILLAARAYHSADLFAGVMMLGVIGYLGNAVLQRVEYRLLAWRRG